MEPLTAFFILEGLTFDIIGAFLVVTGLFKSPFYFPRREGANELNNEELQLQSLIHYRRELSRKEVNTLNYEEQQSIHRHLLDLDKQVEKSRAQFEQNQKHFSTNYNIISSMEQHMFALHRGLKGLPFLIGGFVLQAMGVVTQLLY